MDMLDFSVSSATIRNDFSELTENGYIIQPHTSAGRIPSAEGLRIYIDKIMEPSVISDRQAQYIKDVLSENSEDPGSILMEATKMLSKITGFLSFGVPPNSELERILNIKVVKISSYSSMVILTTNSGTVKTKLYRCDFLITDEIMSIFEKVLNEKLAGLPIADLTLSYVQSLAASLGQLALLMLNVLWAVLEIANDILNSNTFVFGETNLFNFSEYDTETLKNILGLVDNKNQLNYLSENIKDKKVFLGNESKIDYLYDSSLIINQYRLKNGVTGIIGLISTNRINYCEVIPLIEFITETVTSMINRLIE